MIGKLTNEEIEEVLHSNVLGRIGCNDGKKTYVVPLNYVYDGRQIIANSTEGMKIRIMRKNPSICFEVDEMKSFTNWKSVIALGQYQELTEERDRYYAMKLFLDKMMHTKISRTAALAGIPENKEYLQTGVTIKPVIFRLLLFEKTGRFENDELP